MKFYPPWLVPGRVSEVRREFTSVKELGVVHWSRPKTKEVLSMDKVEGHELQKLQAIT